MLHWTYSCLLAVVFICLLSLDHWRKLAFFYDWRRTLNVLVFGTLFFCAWDLAGIHFSIFFAGHSQYTLGRTLGYNFPVEEMGFLLVFCYTILLTWREVDRHV